LLDDGRIRIRTNNDGSGSTTLIYMVGILPGFSSIYYYPMPYTQKDIEGSPGTQVAIVIRIISQLYRRRGRTRGW
jgi:hypothetical protein